MRSILGIGALVASIGALENYPIVTTRENYGPMRTSSGLRRRPGKRYPHSSKRQNERYARQIAAGQLDFSASTWKVTG